MLDLINKNKGFYYSYLVFLMLGAGLQMCFNKSQIFLWINECYNSFFDSFFEIYTYLGDGLLFLAFCFLVLLFSSIRNFFISISFYSITSLIAQFLKRIPFDKAPRPKLFFEEAGEPIRLIENLDIHLVSSFPSGHTTAAFSLATYIALNSKNKKWGFVLFFLAALVGYSRMYLSQHFFADVYFGSMIGVIASTIIQWAFSRYSLLEKVRFQKNIFSKN